MGTARRLLACALALAAVLPAAMPVSAAPPSPVLDSGTTTRLSLRANGSEVKPVAGQEVGQVSISANGRYAVFHSDADLGVPGCGGGVHLRDLTTGRLETISVPARGCVPGKKTTATSSALSSTSISADGRFVAFSSTARDLVPGLVLPGRAGAGSKHEQVYLRDRVRRRTVLVSIGLDRRPANGDAIKPTVSSDGRYVAFASTATNLLRGDGGDPDDILRTDVFVRDVHRGTTLRVGPDLRRAGRGPKWNPSISGNGRFVAFDADAADLAPHQGTGGPVPVAPSGQVWLWDRLTRRTELVSRSTSGLAAAGPTTLGAHGSTKLSHDGRWIVFQSQARNLTGLPDAVLRDPWQVFVHDRLTKSTVRVTDGLAGEGGNGESQDASLSADGRWVVFASAASNLGDADATPGYATSVPAVGTDIYLHHRLTRTTRLVSESSDGLPADANSAAACVSSSGAVAFVSAASTLVAGDTNDALDVFLHRPDLRS